MRGPTVLLAEGLCLLDEPQPRGFLRDVTRRRAEKWLIFDVGGIKGSCQGKRFLASGHTTCNAGTDSEEPKRLSATSSGQRSWAGGSEIFVSLSRS